MRPAPISNKDTLMLKENSNTKSFTQTFIYVLLENFWVLCISMDTYLLSILNNVHIYWDVFIRNQTDPD